MQQEKANNAEIQSRLYNARPNCHSPHTEHRTKNSTRNRHQTLDLLVSPRSRLFHERPIAQVTGKSLEGHNVTRMDNHANQPVRGLTTAEKETFDELRELLGH